MQALQSILNSQPQINDKILSTGGLCIWICWSEGREEKVAKMLEESGGLEIANTATQSLWFFFNVEVTLYALAKIDIWGKQFSKGITVFTFPGELIVGPERIHCVHVEPEFTKITTGDPQGIVYIFTHPALWPYATSIPGISFYDMTILEKQGLFGWKMITADRRLPFNAEHGWFAFLHPLGNPLDKLYQKGWEKIFASIEPVLNDNKLKYALQGGFLSVFISNIQQLRTWVEQILIIFDDIREQHQDIYWPCLSIIVDKNNLNFTSDLHQKLEINWDYLAPDHPYLSYKNAFLLGRSFTINDIAYSNKQTNIDDLCTVSLKTLDPPIDSINPLIAKALTSSDSACFYCGSANHKAAECPSKYLNAIDPDFWKEFKTLDFSLINTAYRTIEAEVNQHGINAYATMLATDDTVSKVILGTFAVNASCQTPNISRIWQITSRDLDETPERIVPQKDPAWGILKRLTQPNQDLNAIERDCINQIAKTPKNWQVHCLRGFVAMEKNEFDKATTAWREAESICTTTAHQAWIKFLIARLKESQGSYLEALDFYGYAKNLLPTWRELDYRAHVCRLKIGFGQNVALSFKHQLAEHPEMMHKLILDPELARGHDHILMQIRPLWYEAQIAFTMDRGALEELLLTLQEWFEETDNPMIYYGSKIRELLDAGNIQNYLLFLDLAEFRPRFEADLIRIINQGITALKQDYEKCLNQVEIVRDEMNWFYFQKALVDFNATFNDCARILNWAFVSNFNDVNIYKEARNQLPELQELVENLRKKLRKLRLVRDITLFLLLMLKTFMKIATALVVLAMMLIFALLFFGDALGMPWSQSLIRVNFWGLLNVVLSITLMLALGISSLKTTVLFEKKRNSLLEAAKEERIRAQKGRIARAKKQREDEIKRAKRKAQKNSQFST